MDKNFPDFDALAALYRRDPQAFEDFRRNTLREAVDRAPSRYRHALENLLQKIEQARKGSPLEAATAASLLMCESVERLCDAWGKTQLAVADLQTALLIERVRKRRET